MLRILLGLLVSTGLCGIVQANEESPSEILKSDFKPFTGKVLGTKVRIRTQPSLEGHVVRETGQGELFAVVGEQDGFYAIQPPQGTKGYVFRTFVLDGVVEGSHVNIRLHPDMESPVIGQLNTGDRVQTKVSDVNNKWLEVALPDTARFYVANEYFENVGPLEMLVQVRARQNEAHHKLSSACLYAQSEMQKPLPQVDLDGVTTRFLKVATDYKDMPEIAERAEEASRLMNEVYVQKKLAFLESSTNQSVASLELTPVQVERLAALGIKFRPQQQEIAQAASETMGLCVTIGDKELTDKMLIWEPIERSLHHLWAATHGGTLEDFYNEQKESAVTLTGMIEAYSRPVKNLPGDYLLRIDNHPVAFLYSTKINLDKLQGKQVTIVGAPRPNNHFAFPAYFVLGVE